NPDKVRQALRYAQAACRLQPDNHYFQNTLALVQYRLGEYQTARATVERAEKLSAAQLKRSSTLNLALQAMVEHQLGQQEQARATLARLREAMKKWGPEGQVQALLREAEAVIEGKVKSKK